MARSMVLGNGNIMVCLDKFGQVRDFYFPFWISDLPYQPSPTWLNDASQDFLLSLKNHNSFQEIQKESKKELRRAAS